jgi:transcriptional regulator with XRE-family HTH domain
VSISGPIRVDADTLRRADLREFLMARRAQITPEEVGLAPGSRRRTPGLRREEVAVLAGVGSSWYQWLEQGRDITVSAQVLDAIARVLRLDEPAHRHLYALAGLNPPERGSSVAPLDCGPKPVDNALIRLVDAWLPNPGHIVDRYWNIVLCNRAAALSLGVDVPGANALTLFFLDDIYRDSIDNWEELAPRVVAQYRSEMTACPGDQGYHWIVEDLAERSPDFARLWADHDVQDSGVNMKTVNNPTVGLLHFESTLLSVPNRPDLRVVLHNPCEGTDTAAKVGRLLAEDERRGGLRLAG